MAHSKQALKRARQNEKLRLQNRAQRAAMKTQMKRFDAAVAAGDPKKVADELKAAQKRLDKAAKRRVIHPNSAARLKSTLARKAHAASQTKPAG